MRDRLIPLLEAADKDSPATRHHLSTTLGAPDRIVRLEIEKLRADGMRVCSSSHGKGYWIAKTEEEYTSFRREYIARAKRQLQIVSAMDSQLIGQIGINLNG